MNSCATCRHALPIHERWHKYGWDSAGNVHCGAWKHETASVIPINSKCVHEPPRWERKDERLVA